MEWILTNERLPKDKVNVLCTINYDSEVHIAYVKEGKWFVWIDDILEIRGDAWIENQLNDKWAQVIAWKELPEHAPWIPNNI